MTLQSAATALVHGCKPRTPSTTPQQSLRQQQRGTRARRILLVQLCQLLAALVVKLRREVGRGASALPVDRPVAMGKQRKSNRLCVSVRNPCPSLIINTCPGYRRFTKKEAAPPFSRPAARRRSHARCWVCVNAPT